MYVNHKTIYHGTADVSLALWADVVEPADMRREHWQRCRDLHANETEFAQGVDANGSLHFFCIQVVWSHLPAQPSEPQLKHVRCT